MNRYWASREYRHGPRSSVPGSTSVTDAIAQTPNSASLAKVFVDATHSKAALITEASIFALWRLGIRI